MIPKPGARSSKPCSRLELRAPTIQAFSSPSTPRVLPGRYYILLLTSQFDEIAENGTAERSNHVKRFWLLAVLTQFLATGAFAELVTYKLSTPGVV